MSIPSAPPARYGSSKQLIAGSDFNNLNDQLNSFQAVTATGVAQTDAAAINAAQVEVLAGSANNAGVILPVSYPGVEVDILNNSANTTKIYPAANGDVIQKDATTYQPANTSVSIVTLTSYTFRCIKKGFWQATKTTGAP